MEMDTVAKVDWQRLSVLEMAETLGNISEECRRGGMDRSSFYEWKRRIQTHGLKNLRICLCILFIKKHTRKPQAPKRKVGRFRV